MMKCVLTLVFLFHLCHSNTITVSMEIIQDLEKLEKLYQDQKLNFTSVSKMRVPTTNTHRNASACAGVIVRELKAILDNVTVPETSWDILDTLTANLNEMGNHTENDHKCQMTKALNLQQIFRTYRMCFRKLIKQSRK